MCNMYKTIEGLKQNLYKICTLDMHFTIFVVLQSTYEIPITGQNHILKFLFTNDHGRNNNIKNLLLKNCFRWL